VIEGVEDRPYVKLALTLINTAVTDFGGWTGRAPKGTSPLRKTQAGKGTRAGLEYQLVKVRLAIDAGRFLLERDDEIVRLWFGVAGVSFDAPRRNPKWVRRLAWLRHHELSLIRQAQGRDRATYRSDKRGGGAKRLREAMAVNG